MASEEKLAKTAAKKSVAKAFPVVRKRAQVAGPELLRLRSKKKK